MILDASVAVKLFFPEPDADIVLALVAREGLIAPDFLLIELANVFWRKQRMGALSDAPAALGQIESMVSLTATTPALVLKAMALAEALTHPVYDCLYLALAIEHAVPVISADRRFVEAVRGSAHSRHIIALADWRA